VVGFGGDVAKLRLDLQQKIDQDLEEERFMAGWGDDPVMGQLIEAVADGWKPVELREERDSTGTAFDVVTAEKEGERREFRSDHLAFHRYVEGLMEDFGLTYS